jgi:hypothetical protein
LYFVAKSFFFFLTCSSCSFIVIIMDAIDELLADLGVAASKTQQRTQSPTITKPAVSFAPTPAAPTSHRPPPAPPVSTPSASQYASPSMVMKPAAAPSPAKPAPVAAATSYASSTSVLANTPAPTPTSGNSGQPTPPKTRDLESAKRYAAELERSLRASGKKFEDPEFAANASALYKSGNGELIGKVWWKRPNEIASAPALFVDGVQSGDVIQGKNDDDNKENLLLNKDKKEYL